MVIYNTKKGMRKLPLFCGNVEWAIPFYAGYSVSYDCSTFVLTRD